MTKGNGRLSATHCVNGHERNEANTYIYHQTKNPAWPMRQCRVCHRERRHADYIAKLARDYKAKKAGN
jgi:hypothetical protein